MKQYPQDSRRWWLVTLTILGILIMGIGIILYHNFFRQNNAKLIETVPEDAAFVFEINNNPNFVKSALATKKYLDELFSFDAFPGFQSFVDKSQLESNLSAIISGHLKNERMVLLFSTRMDERIFKELLKTLKIDPRNYVSFENTQIYSYGTHYKKFNFVLHNNIFAASEDVDLLKQSIAKLRHPHNLLSDKQFKQLYSITEKNTKQDWLIINHERYADPMANMIAEDYRDEFLKIKNIAKWSAFQIRISDNEIHLDGYTLATEPFLTKLTDQPTDDEMPTDILPFNANFYYSMHTPEPDVFRKQMASLFPTESTSLASWDKVQPTSSFLFSISKDTLTYYYFAVPADTNIIKSEQLLAEDQTPDSIVHFKHFDLCKAGLAPITTPLSTFHQHADMTYFTEYHGYYIFANSITALKSYVSAILANTILNNPYYKVSKNNMPTDNNIEFFFFNNQDNNKISPFMDKSHKRSALTEAKVFTYSVSAPVGDLSTTNIFIKF